MFGFLYDVLCFFICYGVRVNKHQLTHSFPPRRCSDLVENMPFDWMVGGEAITVLAPGGLVTANPLFDTDTTGWTADEATIARSTAQESEEHTSELQSLMRISYAVFCLKKKKDQYHYTIHSNHYINPKTTIITLR